jgi:uncharacterized membrane protein (DUF485 family)
MKTLQFKQHHTPSALITGAIYLLFIFVLAYFWLGSIDGMAGKVNSIGDAKGAGFMVGIAVMAPLFILLRLLRPLVTIDIDARKLTIKQKGRQDMMVHFNAIDRIELNAKKINRLDIYDKQHNLLTYLQPSDKPEMLQPIIHAIIEATGFYTNRGSRKMMGKTIDTLVCSNKAA